MIPVIMKSETLRYSQRLTLARSMPVIFSSRNAVTAAATSSQVPSTHKWIIHHHQK
jgi:hypothetical protein